MEGFHINRLALLDKCNKNSKFWIVNINQKYISRVVDNKIFGAMSKKSRNISKFKPKDIIILNTKIDGNFYFIGVSMVDHISINTKKLFNHFLSDKKINLKSIKFFEKPVMYVSIKDKIKVKNLSKKEFIEITRDDIEVIMTKESITNNKPLTLKKIQFNLDEFNLKTIESVYEILNNDNNDKMISVREFMRIVFNVLNMYEVDESLSEFEDFYSHNVWKLNHKHVPSRDPDSNIRLYDAHGKSKNFGYIVFEHKGGHN